MMVLTAMKTTFLVFFCFTSNILGNLVHPGIDFDIYNDLAELNAFCYPIDSCQEAREKDSPEITYGFSCSCHAHCSYYDTCCVDAPYRGYSVPVVECRIVSEMTQNDGYLLVSRCPSNEDNISIWKSLCEDEWYEDDDILKLAPVSSLDSQVLYKNIYCLRCYEETDNLLQWNLRLNGPNNNSAVTSTIKDYSVAYDHNYKTWVAVSDDESVSIAVKLAFQFPHGKSLRYPSSCGTDVISDCHESWIDEHIRNKCRAYISLRYSGFKKFKNPHCAICNYVSLENISCRRQQPSVVAVAAPPPIIGKGFFSFYHLLDLNRDDRSEKLKKQCEENHLWDPYGKRCRKIACAFPGYVIRNGRCSPP